MVVLTGVKRDNFMFPTWLVRGGGVAGPVAPWRLWLPPCGPSFPAAQREAEI